jgi:hypothetical protein
MFCPFDALLVEEHDVPSGLLLQRGVGVYIKRYTGSLFLRKI